MAIQIDARNQKRFADKLWSLKNNEKFCDATIYVKNLRIPVHAVVMASSSEYFQNAFENSSLEKKEVTLNDVNLDVMQILIEYCYTGLIDINEKNEKEVLRLAGIFSIMEIFSKQAPVLEKKLDVNNCLSMWKIGKIGNLSFLKNAALSLSRQNFEEISRSNEFLELEFADVNELISSDLNVTSETVTLQAIRKWTDHDEATRNERLNELLDHVNLSCLPRDVLVSQSLLMCGKTNAKCYKKFMEVTLPKKKTNPAEAGKDKPKCANDK